MAMSDLPRDLLEEILSRVSIKSIRAVQSTCKYWNTITHDQVFTEKLFDKTLATKETFIVVMTWDCQIYLMSVNLHDTNVKSCMMRKAKPLRLNNDTDCQLHYRFIVCDGLLLVVCKTNYLSIIVVWNPYIGETRLIKPRTTTRFTYVSQLYKRYVLGYEKKKTNNSICNHKILGYFIGNDGDQKNNEFELYDLNSDSWKVFYHTCDWVLLLSPGVSHKGNNYWLARGKDTEGPIKGLPHFLICFDFTTERFGPRLFLPFRSFYEDTVTLSSVREEQLAVLFLRKFTQRMEIWVTTKIEPDKVLWNDKLFLTVSIGQYWFSLDNSSFFIDEKKNIVVVLGFVSCIFGKDGYFKVLDQPRDPTEKCCYPLMWSYVPSSVQIKKSSRSDANQESSTSYAKQARCMSYAAS